MNIILRNRRTLKLAAVGLFLLSGLLRSSRAADNPGPGPLAPLDFFTTHEWTALLPDAPDGKKRSIHARCTWSDNHQAIRISNQIITDGKAAPYIDGLYVWNPAKRAIVFWYVGAEGNLSEGTVNLVDGKLVHEFQEIHKDGTTDSYVARVTPLPDGKGWDNEILARKKEELVPLVKVHYAADR